MFQSGFKVLHSTKNYILKVFNDFLLATDTGGFAILITLALTAAFHTADHSIILLCVSLKSIGLDWISSYLSDRSFFLSAWVTLYLFQGFILVPLLFSL